MGEVDVGTGSGDGVESETWMTGLATGRTGIWLATTGAGCGGALLLCVGAITCAAKAISEAGPAVFCAATTPNAARPKVINAAMTMTTTRMVPSATIPLTK